MNIFHPLARLDYVDFDLLLYLFKLPEKPWFPDDCNISFNLVSNSHMIRKKKDRNISLNAAFQHHCQLLVLCSVLQYLIKASIYCWSLNAVVYATGVKYWNVCMHPSVTDFLIIRVTLLSSKCCSTILMPRDR